MPKIILGLLVVTHCNSVLTSPAMLLLILMVVIRGSEVTAAGAAAESVIDIEEAGRRKRHWMFGSTATLTEPGAKNLAIRLLD